MPYVERAPWTVLAPTTAVVFTAVLAVSMSGWARDPVDRTSWRRGKPGEAGLVEWIRR